MRFIYLLLILCCFSCNNERVLLLPEIENAEVTEVLDVSPGYIFYDETQPDSTLLNRKNLIITTNWLINVDKRLTLRQAMPHIKFLQDKKRNAEMHKNEDAKNYFSCNDTSIGNLGFLEFTDVNYELIHVSRDSIRFHAAKSNPAETSVISELLTPESYLVIKKENKADFENLISPILQQKKDFALALPDENMKILGFSINIYFDENLSFQDYISIKSKFEKLNTAKLKIITNEFIF
ncbi:hypothetical protein [uncultured Winogradskyella sp.]|uniref:hypothetical protein n=1 Tax=uncultured Winogradskyella sp. TaxID=395353 RepID=UPI00260954BE|nr:hypothetical protein [uncultured Winogradskyella sp.]|tara:strand:+ start:478 stop:1188 length:711 start_codon:yes stop_codon:yes gene_type:complete